MMEQDGKALLRAIAQGDPNAMEEFFIAYKSGVYRYVMSVLQDAYAAEDVTQEVFVLVFRFASQFTGASSARTWLFAVARNAVAGYWRKKPLEEPYATIELEAAPSSFPLENEFYDTVSVLDRASRDVVAMHIAGGLKHREIAAILGESESAVRQRYARAIKQLRRRIRKEGLL